MSIEIQLVAYDNITPPLPIQNREMKCVYADGTANVGELGWDNQETNWDDNM